MLPRVVILPGNGCGEVKDANWYGWMETELSKSGMFSEVVLENMPDPVEAKESIWIPFIKDELQVDSNTIVIGHSSGAVAAMRLLESCTLLGCILVSACHTDLGDANERASGYYARPWLWDSISANAKWILQYHSSDDPFIPKKEADHVAAQLKSEYYCYTNRSHFFRSQDVDDIIDALRSKLARVC